MTLVPPYAWKPQGVDDLEPRAWDALRENMQSVCLTAGAGAGKTEFLAQKAAYLLQTGACRSPKRILAISFKRDAAGNLEERVGKRCPAEQASRFDSLTFDAFTKSLVDRFRLAVDEEVRPPADYQVSVPNKDDLNQFLTSHGFHSIGPKSLAKSIELTRLPIGEEDGVLKAFWNWMFTYTEHTLLSFAMINRIAESLLRENKEIRRAIQATYPFVFLDEFQDTTVAQYELLKTAFEGSKSIFTAVGDDKQRIMLWAGAMSDAFERFASEFQARQLSLLCNYRSHDELVRLQQVIAERIDPNTETPDARGTCDVDGDVAAIWQFQNDRLETAGIAEWVSKEVNNGLAAHDFAILVRSLPNKAEEELKPAFEAKGLALRNVAKFVGNIAIQDILSEELAKIVLQLVQLGASSRNPDAWNRSFRSLELIEGVHSTDEHAQQKIERRLESIVRELREELSSNPPSKKHAGIVAYRILDFLGIDALRRAYTAYQRQADFDRVCDGLLTLLGECADGASSWQQAINKFMGVDQVALMTVHKSKGLEFHTMIYFGLDNQTWWSLKPKNDEELNSFFVAFTRARQRAFFSRSDEKGDAVSWIENLLVPAGVRRMKGPSA